MKSFLWPYSFLTRNSNIKKYTMYKKNSYFLRKYITENKQYCLGSAAGDKSLFCSSVDRYDVITLSSISH